MTDKVTGKVRHRD